MGCRQSKSASTANVPANKRCRMDRYKGSDTFGASTNTIKAGTATPTPVPSSTPTSLPSVLLSESASSLGGETIIPTAPGSETNTETQHTVTVEEVLDQFRARFIKEVDAEAVVGELLHKDVIDEGDERDITSARNPTRQNEKLHLCLRKKCTLDALMTVCDLMTAVRGNPSMLALGEAMLSKLETEDQRGPHASKQQRAHGGPKAPPSTLDKLRSYYTSSPVVQNNFLAGPAMNYIKINLIKPQEHFPRAGQDRNFASVNLCKGGVNEVTNQRIPLRFEDIFNFLPDDKGSRRRVLVEGVPGSGKTTLVKRMCCDWANGCFAQDSNAVIQVVLRSLPKRDKLTIEDMVLTSVANKKEAADIAKYVCDCQGEGVVFILDGFDEMSVKMRHSSIVRDIIEGRLAPKASFLITSRPISAQSLHQMVDRRIEVTGFGEDEVEKYVTDYFATSNVELGKKLLSTLYSRPTIRSLCYVPLLLLMVCFIASFGKALPRTMHELFEGLVILVVNRNLKKVNRKEHANSLEDVKRLCPSFMKLAKLALEGLKHDTLVFSDVPFEVDEALSGLMNCIEAQNRFGHTTRTWHFLHLTLQEYFAAHALSVAPKAEQIGFWSERLLFTYSGRQKYILSVDRFKTMFLLYCGITGLDSKTGMQGMFIKAADAMFQPTIEDGSALSALCQAVSESGNKELACRIMSTCGSNVQVAFETIPLPVGAPWCIEAYGQHQENLKLSIYAAHNDDCDTAECGNVTPSNIAFVLSQMKDLVTLTGIELTLVRLVHGQGHLKTIAQFLKQQETLKHLTLNFLSYEYIQTFTEDMVSLFWSVLEHHSRSLETIGLSGCEVSQSCVYTILSKLPNLTAFNFDGIVLPANEIEDELVAGAIGSAVYNHPSLKELTTGEGCSPSLINAAVGGIVRKPVMKKLVIADVLPDYILPQVIVSLKNQSLDILELQLSLKSPSTVELFRALPQSELKEFHVTLFDRQMDSSALYQEIEKGTTGCSTLTKLSFGGHSWNRLPSQLSSASMQAAITMQSSLTEVKWSFCSFSGAGPFLYEFAVHLKHSKLRKVTFKNCALTTVDVATLLAEGLSENKTLEQLHIYSHSTPEEVVDATLLNKVRTSIERNTSLQMLYICIQHVGVEKAILKGACGNTSLKKLTIVLSSVQEHHEAVAAELQQVRSQLELCLRPT